MHQSNNIIIPAEQPDSEYEKHALFEGQLAVHSVIEVRVKSLFLLNVAVWQCSHHRTQRFAASPRLVLSTQRVASAFCAYSGGRVYVYVQYVCVHYKKVYTVYVQCMLKCKL